MPPRKRELEENFELNPENRELIRCLICDEELGVVKWIGRKRGHVHLRSKKHQENIVNMQERDKYHGLGLQAREKEITVHSMLMEQGGHRPMTGPFRPQTAEEFISNSDPIKWHFGDDGMGMQFTAGVNDTEPREELSRILQEANDYGEWDLGVDMERQVSDDTVSNVLEQLRMMGYEEVDEPLNADEVQEYLNVRNDSPWSPYKNKAIFLLDMLDNLPRLRLSDSQMRTILWVMKELGARDIPSLGTLRRFQEKLQKEAGVETKRYKSSEENVFYTNEIATQIAQDWANPLVRPWLQIYPEPTDTNVSQTWQASKWSKETHMSRLSPMVKQADQHFYVLELARLENNDYVLPLRWVYQEGQLMAEVFHTVRVGHKLHVDRTVIHSLPVSLLKTSLPRILGRQKQISFQDIDNEFEALELHPLRHKVQGRPVYTAYLALWGDDVSGNKSKQWNVHWNWYFVNAGCPKELLTQEFFVKFASTSPYATNLEQAQALVSQVLATHQNPIITWDCEAQEEVMLILKIHHLPADNPMQSTLSSHIGLKGNCYCRKCDVGGTQEYKRSDEGYHALFQPGNPRNVTTTVEEIKHQYSIVILGLSQAGLTLEEHQRQTGIKDSIAEVLYQKLIGRKKTLEHQARIQGQDLQNPTVTNTINNDQWQWLTDQPQLFNPLLDVPDLDPNCDTPTEPLHTVLLGVVKYIWAATCKEIGDVGRLEDLETRLASIDTRGLGIPPLRASYLIQYRGGLIGRQFKALMQTMVFALHGLVQENVMAVWRPLGKLGALLWQPEIEDMNSYLTVLDYEIANLLDAMAIMDPTRIIQKPKFHILTHIVEDIRRFGPAVLFSTEIFECYNSVFRMCSVLSNHHAPSRDISFKFAEMGRFKHIASGGYWKANGKWIQASNNVRLFFRHNVKLQGLLGWVQPDGVRPGNVKNQPAEKANAARLSWSMLPASKAILLDDASSLENEYRLATFEKAVHVISQAKEAIKPRQFVVYGNGETRYFGRVLEILRPLGPASKCDPLVILEYFYVGLQHETLEMPTLHRDPEYALHMVYAQDILFGVNIQHDCARGNCAASGWQYEVQERQVTNRIRRTIEHQDDAHYIVNLHGLHNAHLLRRIFSSSPDLLVSKPVAENREALHIELATRLRALDVVKKSAAREKREITKRRKAAEKTAGTAAGRSQRQ